jgi:adenylosuccinate synthase
MVGIPPRNLTVMGVVKAYTTRVGGGPFPAELKNTIGTQLQEKGQEIGTVSKRKRRCGWLDLPMLRLAHRLNGFSKLAITKLDVLTGIPQIEIVTAYKLGTKNVSEFPSQLEDVEKVIPITKTFRGWTKDISQVRNYSELPRACQSYLRYIEKALKTQISFISVGSERDSIIHH